MCRLHLRSRQQAFDLHWFAFVLRLALVLAANRFTCHLPKTVFGILARATNQQVLFLIDQVGAIVFSELKIWRALNGIGGAGFFTQTAHDAPGTVNTEKFRIPASVVAFGFLQGNAIYRACHRT